MEPVPPVQFWLLSDNKRVMVMAWDANPKAPMPRDANIEAEGGRGLVLVDALSEEWNWYRVPELGGKVVWAVCALPDSMEPRRTDRMNIPNAIAGIPVDNATNR